MNLDEYKNNIKNVSNHRHHKIKQSYGVYDAYKYYRKNKPKESKYILTESQYFSIIRTINNILREELSLGKDIKLPYQMGRLELKKRDTKIYYEKGKLKTTYSIDWNKTLELWYEDQESYQKKILVKLPEKEIFSIKYNKVKAKYNNKNFYQFWPNRQLKLMLKNNIKNNLIDAFI